MSERHVECGKGWEKLYTPLLQLCNLLNIEVTQVKEKFGGMRFYVGEVPPEQADMVDALISAIEAQSYKTCETCGIHNNRSREGNATYTPVKVTTSGSWRKTFCEQCRVKAKMVRLKADLIREDGRLERTCEHGIGHTVGDVRKPGPHLNQRYFFAHGCCGCCAGWDVEEWKDSARGRAAIKEGE